jgi:hypothetical protein
MQTQNQKNSSLAKPPKNFLIKFHKIEEPERKTSWMLLFNQHSTVIW